MKRNALAGHLSRDLRKKLGLRSMPLRKGDTVKIMRGKNRGREGKITGVNYKRGIVFIEKIIRKKSDGTEIQFGIPASKVLVIDMEIDEKRLRKKAKAVEKKEGE